MASTFDKTTSAFVHQLHFDANVPLARTPGEYLDEFHA
jgi:hypothetical protein